ncbi:glycosyltransferase [Polaribacter sp. M15]
MNVIHIVGSLDKGAGGPSRSVPQTCEQLAKIGVNITLITRPSSHPVTIATSQNLEVKFLTFQKLMAFGRSISNKEFDLIHLQHVWDPYLHIMAWWARRKNIPYIITPRGMLEPWILQQRPWKKKLGLFLYQRFDLKKAVRIHATCELEKNNIRTLGFNNPIQIIPNGVDLSEVKKVKTHYGTKKMVFLSRIHPKKGIELLIDAWSTINTTGWVLEIAGNGEDSYINQLKKSAQDIKNIKFVGAQFGDQKWGFLRSADIMVLPTYSENFGIVVAEALAVGVPVITTKGTPWENLKIKNCGWWIQLSLAELERTLDIAINTTTDILTQKGENGIRLIKNKYDIKSVAKEIKELYTTILE